MRDVIANSIFQFQKGCYNIFDIKHILKYYVKYDAKANTKSGMQSDAKFFPDSVHSNYTLL